MKPLGPGKARTELADNIATVLTEVSRAVAPGAPEIQWAATGIEPVTLAAILGGAIDEALYEVTGTRDKSQRAMFWRYLNHHVWDLTRTLKASNLLDKVR